MVGDVQIVEMINNYNPVKFKTISPESPNFESNPKIKKKNKRNFFILKDIAFSVILETYLIHKS